MDTVSELTSLLNEYNSKKNVLDNHTTHIVMELKEWCINEYARINAELENINKFVTKNWNTISSKAMTDGHGVQQYDGHTYGIYIGFGLRFTFNCDDKSVLVGVDSKYEYANGIGFIWSKLPKPSRNIFLVVNGKNTTFDFNNTSLDYWLDVKRWLAIFNEQLSVITQKLKDIIATLILDQNKRKDEMVNAVGDITNGEVVEVKISIRK